MVVRASFLSAAVPLVKTFRKDPETGAIVKSNYPQTKKFTSHSFEGDLKQMAEAIRRCAATLQDGD